MTAGDDILCPVCAFNFGTELAEYDGLTALGVTHMLDCPDCEFFALISLPDDLDPPASGPHLKAVP